MISTVASALILVERKRLIEVFPESFLEFLNEWEVRLLIVISLILQILLITLGHRRKYVCKIWIRITLWCAYLLADLIATISLGVISKNTLLDKPRKERNVNGPLNQLMWFWAQFFLLHLGGSDTITAYSLEDNELWLRHLLGFLIQTGAAFYILLVALPGSSRLPYLSIPILIAGLIKYGERLFALCAANSENFRDSILTVPDPGPNYAKFMEEFTLKKSEGFYVKAAEVIEIPVQADRSFPRPDNKLIPEAYDLFLTFRCLFADAILSYQDRDSSSSYFQGLLSQQAFDVVEVELGFVFDELYTKASVVYNGVGLFLRTITFSCTVFALIAFPLLCDMSGYKKLDVAITYFLMVGAVCLELYAVWILLSSDWTRNWLRRRERMSCLSMIDWMLQQTNRKRWSGKMGQHNLLDLCVRDRKAAVEYVGFRKLVWVVGRLIKIGRYLEKHWHKTFTNISPELKELIFAELNSYKTIDRGSSDPTGLWNRSGSFTLATYDSISLDWNEKGEFDQKILLWHIATDICHDWDTENQHDVYSSFTETRRDHSKNISDYMMYLLVACPFMLPIGIGMIRFRDTCAEAKEFLGQRNAKCSSRVRACKKLLGVNTEVPPAKVKGDRSKSVLFDACRLAKSLILLQRERRWEIMSRVWVEMLAYAATHCGGSYHARQLRKGGELLTHIWLLMAHLGITEQFQINQGHARAKLIVK